MNSLKIYQEERPWGNFRQFTKDSVSTVKILTVNPNQILSLQSHQKRSEFWKVIKGSGIVEIDDLKVEAHEGDEYEIGIGAKHRLSGLESGISVLEIATGLFDESDIIRYEDKYGRI